MKLSIILWIVGGIWFLTSLFSSADSSVQQTVQYLGFVCSSIFLVGGFILFKLETIKKTNFENTNSIDNNLEEINKNIIQLNSYFKKTITQNDEKPIEKPEMPKAKKQYVVDKIIENNEFWICGKCETKNEMELDFCKNCKKEFWPPS